MGAVLHCHPFKFDVIPEIRWLTWPDPRGRAPQMPENADQQTGLGFVSAASFHFLFVPTVLSQAEFCCLVLVWSSPRTYLGGKGCPRLGFARFGRDAQFPRWLATGRQHMSRQDDRSFLSRAMIVLTLGPSRQARRQRVCWHCWDCWKARVIQNQYLNHAETAS